MFITACPKGTYKSMLEPTDSCTLCPEGSTTAEEASTRLSDCYCKEGYAGDPSKGIPCERENFFIIIFTSPIFILLQL